MSVATGSKLGPYEILAPLGAGGMGEVYRARDSRLARDVAVKVLPAAFSADADRLRRFEQEARAAAGLNHPNILAVHDIGTHDGAPYIVSELLEGETLRERLARGTAASGSASSPGGLSVRKAIDHAIQIAHGLSGAHEKGIVHRDLKPENLFVTADGRVKILDFGLAKLRPDVAPSGAGGTGLPTEAVGTEPGMLLGTMGYMAPEQVRGHQADHRSDIFAFGAVLYEMLSGQRAFRGPTNADTISAILDRDPPDLPVVERHIPPALGAGTPSQLVWFGREGQRQGELGDRAAYSDVELSKDGTRATVSVVDPARRSSDIWIYDVARGLRTKFTFDAGTEQASVWSPDGSRIVYSSTRTPAALYENASNGSGSENKLPAAATSATQQPTSWSLDGRFITYTAVGNTGSADIWVLPLFGDRKDFPFLQTPASEVAGKFSPDGRWFAYVSAESGRNEVYVAPFPGPGGKSLVSTSGGVQPRWRRDGTELFYFSTLDNKLMSAGVNGRGAGFQVGAVRPLFEVRGRTGGRSQYDVSPDGQRFLFNVIAEQQQATPPITLVVNWTAGLKAAK